MDAVCLRLLADVLALRELAGLPEWAGLSDGEREALAAAEER